VTEATAIPADPTTAALWDAAQRGELLLQRCAVCGAYQHYPRPVCVACGTGAPEDVPAAGTGTVYATTTVHLRVHPDLEPPYTVAVVELDEGPRLVTHLVNGASRIGERVRLTWRERPGATPLPVFEPDGTP
jgi:uncharacterized OB-fold protein